uniref:Putative secreted protein n=1 Tax=Anopheles darlingi TaxID=43151 RepID=A0A2M4DM60_ANODA
MKKGTEGASKVALAVAAASALAAENVDLWARPGWIKDILSKSGTEIKEVPAEGNTLGFEAPTFLGWCSNCGVTIGTQTRRATSCHRENRLI